MGLRNFCSVILLGLALWAIPSFADDATTPADKGPVLQVAVINGDTKNSLTYAFTMAMLKSMPKTSYTTNTIWTEGETQFDGVLLTELLATIGASPTSVTAWAINDYMAEFSPGEPSWDAALITYSMNGQNMHVREKGPLWIVFPYDESPEFRTDYVYSQSVWQLSRLDVE